MLELPLEITVHDVRRLIGARLTGAKDPVLLVDVREPMEHAIARIEDAELIPMQTIPQRIQHLEDRDGALIVICHHGVRSLQVAAWLRDHGVENAQSMTGGIDAWSRLVDPAVPRY